MRLFACLALCTALAARAQRPDMLVADFEGADHGYWKVTGHAFGSGPAHGNVDRIVQTDLRPPKQMYDQKREFAIVSRYVLFPIENGAPKRRVTVSVEGQPDLNLDMELTDHPDWWAFLDVGAWQGRKLTVCVSQLPENSEGLNAIRQSDALTEAETLYDEALRPQLHFTSRRGWNNDPNGLVFFQGEYHLFYQHNPYGTSWGNMHWGHAVSRDLVHWRELGDALAPDELGPMFSGSAVVDWKNTSKLGHNGQPPLVLIYTASGRTSVQCLAYSTDGRTFTKYAGNPVFPQLAAGDRDPKVFWYKPLKQWVMALYIGIPDPPGKDPRHTIHLLSSPNLKDWKVMSRTEGFYECPDLFELPVRGADPARKWVLTAASSDYMLGWFDGRQFVAQTEKLPGHRGLGFYAAQTFSDIPAGDGRCIQLGWLQAPSPGMPFNQAISLPLELKLLNTPEGMRLARAPVKELQTLRIRSHPLGPLDLKPGDPNPLAGIRCNLLEVRTEFDSDSAAALVLTLRGARISYNFAQQTLIVNGHSASAPLRGGRQRLTIYLDRTALEVFASDGLTYMPMPFIPQAGDLTIQASAVGGTVKIAALEVHELKSIWMP